MKKMAIIGTGIAGMSAAYFLQNEYEITLFEKNDYIGGHTNTIMVNDGKVDCPMDTGFMVFNEKTYPYLIKFFSLLGVSYENTDMSFSVRNDERNFEYNGSNLDGLFSQRKNLLNFKFLKMIKEILRFNQHAPQMLNDVKYDNMTLKEYIDELGLSDYFFTQFLVPMSSAVWSTPPEKLKIFPAKSLVRFFYNHGFVGINTQLQWKTVTGGSREYVKRIFAHGNLPVVLDNAVEKVIQFPDHVEIESKNEKRRFDKVIICTHADEALTLLKNPTQQQQDVLGKFSYQKNVAIAHTDESVMPKLKKNWASWNFIMKENQAYTVYYMNRLQRTSPNRDFFININGEDFVDSKKIIKKIVYHHPIFDVPSIQAQKKIDQINRQTHVHFSGSYYRYGFHEDALLSSVNLCSAILGREILI